MCKKALSQSEWEAIRKDHIAAIKLMLMTSGHECNVVECSVRCDINDDLVWKVYLSSGQVMAETIDGCKVPIDMFYTYDIEDIRKSVYNQIK